MITRNTPDFQTEVIKDLTQVGDLSLYFDGSQFVFSARQVLAAIDATPDFMESFYAQVYGYPSAAQVCLSLLDSNTTPKRLLTTLNTDIVKKEADKHSQKSAESLTYEAIVGNTDVLNLITYALGMFKVSVSSITTRKDRGFAFNVTSAPLSDKDAKALAGVISSFLAQYNDSRSEASSSFSYVVQFTDNLNERLSVDYVPTSVKDSLPPVDGDAVAVSVSDSASDGVQSDGDSDSQAAVVGSSTADPVRLLSTTVKFGHVPFGFSVSDDDDRHTLYEALVAGLDGLPEYSSHTTYNAHGVLALVLYSKPGMPFITERVLSIMEFLSLNTSGDYIFRSDRSKGSITIKVKE